MPDVILLAGVELKTKREGGFRHPSILFWIALMLGGAAGLLFAYQHSFAALLAFAFSVIFGILDYRI